jgi:hypothetical protein
MCTTNINDKFAASATGVVGSSGKFATIINKASGPFATGVKTMVAYAIGINYTDSNLPLVSMTQLEIIETISKCLHLKVNLKKKCICIC